MLDPWKHNYVKKLLALHRQGKINSPNVFGIDIYHDDWCGVYRGQYCNCNPEIKLRRYGTEDPRRN